MQSKCQHNKQAPIATLKDLPINQGGVARHRCAICAYEQGYLDGFHAVLDFLQKIPSSNDEILSLKRENNNSLANKIAKSLAERVR